MNASDTLTGSPGDHPEFDRPPADPLRLLQDWIAAAFARGVPEPTAASLATVGLDGAPSARFVALKQVTAHGVVFATSAASPKGREMSADRRVALSWYWPQTLQQVRIEGRVRVLGDDESDRLFEARPRAARAAAIISHQSAPLASEDELLARVRALADSDEDLRRPAQWCGWLVTPARVEFWLGSRDRLHRRLVYTREAGEWAVARLQP
ncbi:MAG TPA: pyridoxamine 5'-phosphate oxidase [Actinomycetaceae bacterium]|nr:pyridoxamine 5'-phosphate oxidase [Actinomycetaceae bacterium]